MDRNLPAGDFNGAGRDIEIITRPSTTTTTINSMEERNAYNKPRDIEVFTRPSALKPSTDFYMDVTQETTMAGKETAGQPVAASREMASTGQPAASKEAVSTGQSVGGPRNPQESLALARAKLKDLEAYRRGFKQFFCSQKMFPKILKFVFFHRTID